ncbi:MAG: DUF502 domain-containing protein [Actinobacteria bacterium]|nr:DUF502 domain-containing protein [Actinomycetota bacterium]
MQKKGFWANFKHFFFRGLAAILPSLLTLVLVVKGYQFINQYVGGYVNWALIRIVAYAQYLIFGGELGQRISHLKAIWDSWYLHITGFIIAICLIYILGVFLASFLGRWIWRLIEALLGRTPVVKQVYPQIKQVTDFFLSSQRLNFTQVVAVEYPRKGIWSLGLVTGQAPKRLQEHLDTEAISVFMPSSPTPLTGYVICTRRSDVVELAISIDEAFRFIISGGVLKPSDKLVDGKPVVSAKLPSPPDADKQS